MLAILIERLLRKSGVPREALPKAQCAGDLSCRFRNIGLDAP
jgi:hypothetical protein